MKQLILEQTLNDDDLFDIGGDAETLIKNLIGEQTYYHSRVSFELEYVNRDWNQQTQTIRIYIVGNYKELVWFQLQYTPKANRAAN